MMPTFIVIGAQKCGTTSLCAALAAHPDVFVSYPKEPHFFSKNEVYEQGLSWYERLFEGAERAAAAGEGSTSYTFEESCQTAAARIAQHVPDVKLIYIVRHPLRRIESAYMHRVINGRHVEDTLDATLETMPELVHNSLYWRQINVYRQHFRDEQIMVLFFEDMIAAPQQTLQMCARFLEIDDHYFRDHDVLQQRNESVGRRRRTWLTHILLDTPGSKHIRRMVPQPLRHLTYRLVAPRVTQRVRLEGAAAQRVIEQVRPDAEAFLRFYGKPVDFWAWDQV